MQEFKPVEHGGNLYAAMRSSGRPVAEFLDFSANINPLGLADSVKQAIINSIEYIIHYPDADAVGLRTAIHRHYQVPYETIVPANGAVEMLYVLCGILRPRRVLITAPAFSEYERAARAARAEIRYFELRPENGFEINVDDFIAEMPGSDIVFVGNPNNPTGTLLRQEEIEHILQAANAQGIYVVADESFIDFLPDDSPYTCRPLLAKYENLMIIHSLTKFYAIPGLRLGFALAGIELAQKLQLSKDPWNVNSLAQSAGVAALEDVEYRDKSRRMINAVKQEFYQQLNGFSKLKPYTPSVNFILVNIHETGFSAGELRRQLMDHNILIRDCSNYPGLSPDYIRLAIKMPEQNEKLLSVLGQIIGA